MELGYLEGLGWRYFRFICLSILRFCIFRKVYDRDVMLLFKCWDKKVVNRFIFEYLFNFFDDYFILIELNYKDFDE